MTREEIIDGLYQGDSKAIKEAIKALEQEPCGDCCNGNQIEKAKLCQRSYLAGMEHRQEPKTGHWIEYTKVIIPEPFNSWKQAWKCSECGYGGQDDEEDGWLEWNYCPDCGAKMEG